MDDQSAIANLDSLLLQLALHTRELSQKKDGLNQRIATFQLSIQQRKACIVETKKSIKKLEEDILHKRNAMRFHKENIKSLKATGSLLLQYEKSLQAELERKQDSCNQDMKMYQERIESYWKVFQQHKEHYCQHPLAIKLLQIQAEKEEIEQRIRASEEQIIAEEKVLKSLQEETDIPSSSVNVPDSGMTAAELYNPFMSQTEGCTQPPAHIVSYCKNLPQTTAPEQEDTNFGSGEVITQENQDKADGNKKFNPFEVGPVGSIVWTKPENRGHMQGSDQKEAEETPMMDGKVNATSEEIIEDEFAEMEGDAGGQTTADCEEETERAGCSQASPARMKAVLNTPTFSLNSSLISSTHDQQDSETKSPAFVFSVNEDPSIPTFSGFDCGFSLGSAQEEDTPFTFSSSYFSDKKSLESKFTGFPFDQSDSRSEEEFSFSFPSSGPQPKSASQESGGPSDAFPFSFSFGKF